MNKLLLRVLGLVLCACLAVGLTASFTLAYYSVRTPVLVNTFVPGDIPDIASLTLPLTVKKTVVCTGEETIGPEGFRFLLADSVSGEQLAVMTSDANGNAGCTLTYTHDDIGKTYGYRLTEINDGRENVTYSEQSYYIQVRIILDEAQDMLVPVLHMNGQTVYRLETAFENMYYVETPLPSTGDSMNIMLCVALMTFSGAALLMLRKRAR